ncbi:hypothetical protein SAMN05421788_107132 [Filimonas lacunae]|uniref:Uncharacterized protein n=1 Tax=Filimonas lacunae TaxID=477680 RepID=A0A173MG63_9BACT|nr:hypothetical protein [Filimonas lacunae]BAV06470.1 hypothetical protein FLA_2489 [Filimonas lacunae]SIT27080.1 hypothetical protein SAMN05421788_107132 [Filimonas lacunae]
MEKIATEVIGMKNDNSCLIRFQEQIIDNFLIPAFTLYKGELVIIQYPGGPLFSARFPLIELLTARTSNDNTEVTTALHYPGHLKVRSSIFNRQYPSTVSGYLNKYANKNHPFYNKIYGIDEVRGNVKINMLSGYLRQQLGVYAILSRTSNIVFDLAGVDPVGGVLIFNVVKSAIAAGGACILLDLCDEFKDLCTTFIQTKYVGPPLE